MNKPKPKPNNLSFVMNTLVLIAVVFLIYLHFKPAKQIVYVDSGKLLAEYKGAQAAKKAFDTKAGSWKMNIDTLTQEVQNAIKHYEKSIGQLNQKELDLARKSINIKRKEMAEYQKAIQENAARENSKVMAPVILDVNQFLLKYGKEHDYKMILIANQSGTIAYAEEGLDVTRAVIEELNQEYAQTIK